MPDDIVRLSINLSQDVADVLRRLQGGGTATETVRRAISVFALFTEVHERGARVLIEEADGELREVVFPY